MFENIKKRLDDAKKTVDIYDNGDFLPPVGIMAFDARICAFEIFGVEDCMTVYTQKEVDQIMTLNKEDWDPESWKRIVAVQRSIEEYRENHL
ncbi:MAG: hypothetical protein LUD84_10890 [Clostridiales bacterium]|nr:hypothetical protein [Clostridiales bacterium]